MEGYGLLITAILGGIGSATTAIGGVIVLFRKGDADTRARLAAAEAEGRDLRAKLLIAEARLFDLMRRLVGAGLMTQEELERGGSQEPTS